MKVLLVVHGFPPGACGGTEIYTEALAHALLDAGCDVSVLAREADREKQELALRREERDGIDLHLVNNTFRSSRSFADSYRNEGVRDVAARVIDEERPDVVHIQHLTCLSTEIPLLTAARGIPTMMTLHDYWLLCHRGQLLDLDLARCDGHPLDGCPRCIVPAFGAWPIRSALASLARGSVSARLARARAAHMREVCASATLLHAPSRTLEQRFLSFGVDPGRICLEPLGIDARPFVGLSRTQGHRLRIGFLGSLMVSKAPHVLLDAFAMLPSGAASLHIYGSIVPYHGDDSYRARLEPLLCAPGVVHAGPLPHQEVPRALADLDVLVVPSIWIENTPLVIREAFASGVPVVASDLGGMSEMVRHERDGLLFRPGDAADLARSLSRLALEPGLLPRLRAGIPAVRTIEEDARWAVDRYQRLCASRTTVGAPGWSSRLAAIIVNFRTPGDSCLCARSLLASRRPIDDLLVVDNGSGDGSAEALGRELPEATVIASAENIGFSAGCNLGIREALARGAERIFLVNPDVFVPPDAIERLDRALDRPGVGIAGPVQRSRSDPDMVASRGIVYHARTGRMRHRGFGAPFTAPASPAGVSVDGVAGSALLVHRRVLETAGLLHEPFFFTFEDLEFCLRARRAGFLTVCVEDACVYHEGSGSMGARTASRIYYGVRNHLMLSRRADGGGPLARIGRAACIVAFNLAHVLLTSPVPRLAGLCALGRGIADHARGRYGRRAES